MPTIQPPPDARVTFTERRTLRARDLSAEQAYLISLRRLHDVCFHGWGIVSGLCIRVDDPLGPRVESGMAVDRFGRELIVAAPISLSSLASGGVYDVWLLYGRRAVGEDEGRWREDVVLRVVTIDPDTPPVRPSLPSAALSFTLPAPDDPAVEAPVFLGRLDLRATPAVNASGRTYAQLLGEAVVHPDGFARMQVGAEGAADRRRFVVGFPDGQGGRIDRLVIDTSGNAAVTGHLLSDGTCRFDLRLMSPLGEVNGIPTEGNGLIIVAAVNNVLHFRIFDGDGKVVIDTDEGRLTGQARQIEDLKKQLKSLWPPHTLTRSERGRVTTAITSIFGHTRTCGKANGDLARPILTLVAGEHSGLQPSFGGMEFGPLAQVPKVAKTWQIYHAAIPDKNDPKKPPAHELRVEIEHPGTRDNPANSRFAVWTCSDPAGSGPDPTTVLAVRADGKVEIAGDISIGGQLLQGPIDANGDHPRFRDILATQWAAGLAQGIETLSPGGLSLVIPDTPDSATASCSRSSGSLAYTLAIQNISAFAVDSIQIAQNVVSSGTALAPGPEIQLFRLDAGQTKKIPQTVSGTFTPGQVISVGAMAIGVSATGKVAFDTPGAKNYTIP